MPFKFYYNSFFKKLREMKKDGKIKQNNGQERKDLKFEGICAITRLIKN